MNKQYQLFTFLSIALFTNTTQSADRIAVGMLPIWVLTEVWRTDAHDFMDQPNVQKFLKSYDSKHYDKRPSYDCYPKNHRARHPKIKQPRSR